VLQAVERQFRKTGYAGTSLDDLCAVTGLGRGSLYAAFGDKHSLFLAAFGGYCDRNESLATVILSGPDDEAARATPAVPGRLGTHRVRRQ